MAFIMSWPAIFLWNCKYFSVKPYSNRQFKKPQRHESALFWLTWNENKWSFFCNHWRTDSICKKRNFPVNKQFVRMYFKITNAMIHHSSFLTLNANQVNRQDAYFSFDFGLPFEVFVVTVILLQWKTL